jgi:hypothetical protein
MLSQLLFLTKVMVWSLLLAIAIKWIAPLLSIPVTNTNALVLVTGLPLILLMVLLWRLRQEQSQSSTR